MSAFSLARNFTDPFLPNDQRKETEQSSFLQLPSEIRYRIYQYAIEKGEVHIGVRNEIIHDDDNPSYIGGLAIKPPLNQRIFDEEKWKVEVRKPAMTHYCDNLFTRGGFTMRPCLYQRTFDEHTGTWGSHYNAYLEATHKKCLLDGPDLSLFHVCIKISHHAREAFFSQNRLIFPKSEAVKHFIANKEACSLVRHICLQMDFSFGRRFNRDNNKEDKLPVEHEKAEANENLKYSDEAEELQKAITSLLTACPGIQTVMLDGGFVDAPEIPARHSFLWRACKEIFPNIEMAATIVGRTDTRSGKQGFSKGPRRTRACLQKRRRDEKWHWKKVQLEREMRGDI